VTPGQHSEGRETVPLIKVADGEVDL